MIQIVKFCFTAFILGLFLPTEATIPDYIIQCKRNDPDLSQCIINSINHLRPRMVAGIPELGIPPIDPLKLDRLVFGGSSKGGLSAVVTDLEVFGASRFQILNLGLKFAKDGFNMLFEVNIPHMDVTGKYNIDTNVLFLNLIGDGPARINITDYHFVCSMKGNKINRPGYSYLKFDLMKCSLEIGPSSIYLDNLFNGNVVLEQATNRVINQNADVLFEEFKPYLISAVTEKFTDLANRLTATLDYDELFL